MVRVKKRPVEIMIVAFPLLLAAGCSADNACMDQWHDVVCDCFQDLGACNSNPQNHDCDDEFDHCLGDVWWELGECAEPGGCLESYVMCFILIDDKDPGECEDEFEDCAYWYDRYDYNPPYSCES